MRGRKQTMVSMNQRTWDVLEAIKKHRGDTSILRIIDQLFSVNENKRDEALDYIYTFIQDHIETATWNGEEMRWELDLDRIVDPEYPISPE